MKLLRALPWVMLATSLTGPTPPVMAQSQAPSAMPPAEGPQLIDRVLAVVDEDPILQSEVTQVLALGLVEQREGESDRDVRRRILDQLIEQRLRFHEIDSFGFVELPTQEVEEGLRAIRERFASASAFAERLTELGLEEATLKQLVARQLMVLSFVSERLGPRVFVDLQDIQAYYQQTLMPEMERRAATVPPLPEVREQIRGILKEQRLNEEIVRWTDELRRQADVEDYFEEVEGALPGVVAKSVG